MHRGAEHRSLSSRSMRRSIRRQLEEPMDAACYYDGPDSSDDEAILCWPVVCEEPSDGPQPCSGYELKRLQTMVAIILCSNPANPNPNTNS